MTNVNKRLSQLNLLLQYCTDNGGIFTTGERILINQERGKIMVYDNPFLDIRHYQYSEKLEQKINQNLKEINNSNWLPVKSIEINWKTETTKLWEQVKNVI
mgnify:CR=1 FL=1